MFPHPGKHRENRARSRSPLSWLGTCVSGLVEIWLRSDFDSFSIQLWTCRNNASRSRGSTNPIRT